MQAFGLLFGEGPGVNLDGIDPGIIEDMIAVQIDNIERRRRVDMSQSPQRDQTIVVGLRVIPRPTAAKSAKSVAAATGIAGRILQPAPVEFRWHVGAAVVRVA